MPLYEYECPECGCFELIQKFSDALLTECPTCKSPVEKLLSAPAIQFKGTGWYITDYARKGKTDGKDDRKDADGAKVGAKTDSSTPKESSSKSDSSTSKSDTAGSKSSSSGSSSASGTSSSGSTPSK